MSRKILLADDSLTIQKVVELTFAETDYEVIAVSSGDELLERLRDVQPDIVICDVIMPGRDGYDVCQEIKSNPDSLHLPVVLLTGTFEPFDRDRALAAGCSEIITKPFEAKKLVETVEQLSTGEGAAPPAAPDSGEDDGELEWQVTPPPPIAAPETTFDSVDEGELDASDVRHEFVAEEPAAEEPVEPVAAVSPEAEFDPFADEAPAFEAAAQSIAIEYDSQGDSDSFELPDVEEPPEPDAPGGPPTEDLNTVASDSWIDVASVKSDEHIADEQMPEEEIEDPFSSEADDQQPEETMDDPFGSVSDDSDTVEVDTPTIDEPATVDTSDRTMTTPIDVASVMAQADTEEESPAGGQEVESIDGDPSDADTQDVTEKADEAQESVDADMASESIEFEPLGDPFEPEPQMESIEFEDPAQTIGIEAPSDPVEAEAPAGSFELDTPEEPVAIEPPSDPFEAEEPVETFAPETPEESVAVEPPEDSFEAGAPAETFAPETPEESVEAGAAAEPVAAAPPAEPAEIEAAGLSDDDVDRIARRLLELAGDRIEAIAWEVVPDMAEIVVRERVRELEGDSEQ